MFRPWGCHEMKKELRERVYKRYGGRCAYCGEKIEYKAMQIDHIVPKERFSLLYRQSSRLYGVDDIENLNPSCRKCNNFKTVWTLEEFRRELSQQITRGRERSVNWRMAEKFGLIQVTNRPVVFYFETQGVKSQIKEE